MKKLLSTILLLVVFFNIQAQQSTSPVINIGTTPFVNGTNTRLLFQNANKATQSANLTFNTATNAFVVAGTINALTLTAPATAATLTLANNSSLITSGANSLTLTTTGPTNVTLPTSGTLLTSSDLSGYGLLANPLSQFAATTSLQLKNTISDETGSGLAVFATSPVLTTPNIGVATATSVNGNTISTGTGTLTLGASKVATISNTLTFTGTDGSTLNVGTGGTLGTNAYTSTAYAPLASPTFTGTVTIPTPFTLGATSVTSTGTQLNYLASATGTTGTASTNLVFSTSPTLVTPVLGVASGTSLTLSSLTSTRIPFATTAGLLTDGAGLIWNNSGATLNINGSTGTVPGIDITGNGTIGQIACRNTGTTGQASIFCINNTNSAAAQLDAFGSASAGTIGGLNRTGMASLRLFPQTGGVSMISAEGAFPLVFAYNSTEVARITDATLAVTGATNTQIRISSTATGTTGIGTSYVYNSTGGAYVQQWAYGSASSGTRMGLNNTGGAIVELAPNTGGYGGIYCSSNFPMVFGTNNIERARFLSTGAFVHAAGSASAGSAPIKLTSGTVNTTAETGAVEYNGTNLFFTRTGTTRETVITANAVNVVSPVLPNRTITVVIDGTTYYISAKTTND